MNLIGTWGILRLPGWRKKKGSRILVFPAAPGVVVSRQGRD
jgi:hypothetical protein